MNDDNTIKIDDRRNVLYRLFRIYVEEIKIPNKIRDAGGRIYNSLEEKHNGFTGEIN